MNHTTTRSATWAASGLVRFPSFGGIEVNGTDLLPKMADWLGADYNGKAAKITITLDDLTLPVTMSETGAEKPETAESDCPAALDE